MEAFAGLLQGFDVALKPINLLWGFIGVTLGIVAMQQGDLAPMQVDLAESTVIGSAGGENCLPQGRAVMVHVAEHVMR